MPQEKERLLFIDIFRGIAVLWMIETHVVNAYMIPLYRKSALFGWINLSNGIVAVSFLFCAGAGFYLAASFKWDSYKKADKPLFLYLRRLGFIACIAYFLHLPVLSFKELISMKPEQALVFFQSDILQVIVLCSLFALMLLFLSPSIKYLTVFSAIVSAAVFITAPFVWNADPFNSMPVYIAAFFAKPPVSNFPMFPWSGYFFAGIAVTGFLMTSVNRKKFAIAALIISSILVIINYNTSAFQPQYGFHDWWGCAPGHSIFRLGCAVSVFSILYLFENSFSKAIPVKFLLICGRESLFMYATHLLIVYGSILSFGLKNKLSGRLDIIETVLFYAALTSSCFAGAWLWHKLKEKNIRAARIIMTGLAWVFIFIFGSGIWGS